MKVLIINTFIRQDISTAKIAYKLLEMLIENGHSAIFAYGLGNDEGLHHKENTVCFVPRIEISINRRLSYITGYNSTYGPIGIINLGKLIRNYRPDVIQLYNLHGNYVNIPKLFDLIGSTECPVVYSMLDEYPYLGHCAYAYDCNQFKDGCMSCNADFKKKGAYPRSLLFNRARWTVKEKEREYKEIKELVFVGPRWVKKRAEESYLLKNKHIEVVDEFVDNEKVFFPRSIEKIQDELKIPSSKIILLNVSRSDEPRKGIQYYIDLARRFEDDDRFIFINVGYQGNYEAIRPKNFIGIDIMSDQNVLAEYYSMADLYVCTSMADTMPNACIDALSCGTPIVGFNITGIPYTAEKPMGHYVKAASVDDLELFVRDIRKKNSIIISKCRDYAIKRYSPTSYYNSMMAIYEKVVKKI